MGNNFSNEKYLAARDRLVEKNENFINNIYLDTYGLPTAGIGVLLVERQKDRSWELNYSRVNLIADITKISDDDRRKLISTLEKYTDVLDKHKDKHYQTLADFRKSTFGKEAQSVLGDISFNKDTRSWDVLTSAQSTMKLTMTNEQTLELYNRISSEYEVRLDTLLAKNKCPVEALSEEQRAGLYSMVYHGSTNKAGKMADAIGDYWRGEISEEKLRSRIKQYGTDQKFQERSENEIEYMNNIKQNPNKFTKYNLQNSTSLVNDAIKSEEELDFFRQFRNDKDGSFASKMLAENPQVMTGIEERVQEQSQRDMQQQQVAREMQEIAQQQARDFGGRSFG
ncbi:hypothetical protein [Neisseria sp. CCUG12390]|uniref:hypothetical protein n=1 Tax=Neisseria sp. CCUG12390 TaxID=3392035 RepID=UPI003A0FD4D9